MAQDDLDTAIRTICEHEPRYRPAAYRFVLDSLDHTLKARPPRAAEPEQGAPWNVSGRDLLESARDLAVERFGALARDVLFHWGLTRTDDVGEVVFHMVEARLLRKTDSDSLDDYRDVFPWGAALDDRFLERLEVETVVIPAPRRGTL